MVLKIKKVLSRPGLTILDRAFLWVDHVDGLPSPKLRVGLFTGGSTGLIKYTRNCRKFY